MRKGQKINKHCHSTHQYSYLSGHFTVACNDTSTIYFHPYNQQSYPLKNSPNSMTMFPTWMAHKTDSHEVDIPRITIAFDILISNPDEETTKDDNLVITVVLFSKLPDIKTGLPSKA